MSVLQREDRLVEQRSQGLWWCSSCYVQDVAWFIPGKGTSPHLKLKTGQFSNWRPGSFFKSHWAAWAELHFGSAGFALARHILCIPITRICTLGACGEAGRCLPWSGGPRPADWQQAGGGRPGFLPGAWGDFPLPDSHSHQKQGDSCLKSQWLTWRRVSSDFNNSSTGEEILLGAHPPLVFSSQMKDKPEPFCSHPRPSAGSWCVKLPLIRENGRWPRLSERQLLPPRPALCGWWGNFFLSFWYPRRKKNNKTRSVNKGVRVSGCLLLWKRPRGRLLPGWEQTFVKDFILEHSKDAREGAGTRGRKRQAQRGEEMKRGRRQESCARWDVTGESYKHRLGQFDHWKKNVC